MRKRIVINLDAQSGNAPQHRQVAGGKRRRWTRVLGILFGLFVVVIVGALIGWFIWWQYYQSTPTYTLTLLVDAAQRNDAAEFEKLIDSEEIAKNMVATISEKAAGRYGLALSGPIQQQINAVVPSVLPKMKQTIHDEMAKGIREFSSASEQRSFIFLLVTVPNLVKVTTEGNIAKATAAISDRKIELTMKRDAERWKVTEFKDDVMVQRIVDSIMKELPAIGSVDPKSPLLKQSPRGRRGRRR